MRTVSDSALREGLAAALSVNRFVDDVAAQAPFPRLSDLMSAASASASTLTSAEIDEAMAHHPRIGERAVGEGAAKAFSRAEQASSDADDPTIAAALAEGNRAYEARFGRVFLIRAAGRSRAEILAELTRRITLDDATELAIVGDQLRQIALLRIEATFDDAAVSAPDGASV